jgi:hypothetical protein
MYRTLSIFFYVTIFIVQLQTVFKEDLRAPFLPICHA